ncbi:MAG: nucleotidyltransferase domain-containing protein [Elusimicrobia bacterium]|nr:nucleotidyltransferase domain-containing protein [Candidatus Liberimonas magnetica]
MAAKKNVIKSVVDLCKELEENRVIEIKSAYLFGSTLISKANSSSDIDLAIVSQSFSGFKFNDRAKINPYILKINPNIEIHPFKIDEFNPSNPFAKEIIKTGLRVY